MKIEEYLVPRPVENGARSRRFGVSDLRRGEEAAGDGGEAVQRRGARPVAEVLRSGAEVPAADAGVGRR